jgi:hypothetical protein
VPDDDDVDEDDDALLVVALLLTLELASVVGNDPPDPPAPPAPPGPLSEPVLPPEPVLSLVTVPDEAQPVLSTPKIKDRVDPRTSWWRMVGDSAEIRRLYKPHRSVRGANRVDAWQGTRHHPEASPCPTRRSASSL